MIVHGVHFQPPLVSGAQLLKPEQFFRPSDALGADDRVAVSGKVQPDAGAVLDLEEQHLVGVVVWREDTMQLVALPEAQSAEYTVGAIAGQFVVCGESFSTCGNSRLKSSLFIFKMRRLTLGISSPLRSARFQCSAQDPFSSTVDSILIVSVL